MAEKCNSLPPEARCTIARRAAEPTQGRRRYRRAGRAPGSDGPRGKRRGGNLEVMAVLNSKTFCNDVRLSVSIEVANEPIAAGYERERASKSSISVAKNASPKMLRL